MSGGDLILARAGEIAIEAESTSGTAETLQAADVAGRVAEPSFDLQVETTESELDAADLSEFPDFIGNLPAAITGMTYMKGSGTAGAAPDWGKLLADSGQWTETEDAGTSITYTPKSSAGNSATVGLYRSAIGSGGRAYVIKGARLASMTITITAGGPVKLEYTYQGAFSSDPDTAPLGGTFDATIAPVAKQMTTFTLDSWTPLLRELVINIEWGLARVDNPGDSSDVSGICNYEPTTRRVTGSMQFMAQKAGTEDYIADLLAGTTLDLTATIGATAGNILTIEIPKLQYLSHGETSLEDLIGDTLDFKAQRGASGDDEISITLT